MYDRQPLMVRSLNLFVAWVGPAPILRRLA
jgi:hypothetical protein